MDQEKTDLGEMDMEEVLPLPPLPLSVDVLHETDLEEVYSFEITRYFSFSTLKMERKH